MPDCLISTRMVASTKIIRLLAQMSLDPGKMWLAVFVHDDAIASSLTCKRFLNPGEDRCHIICFSFGPAYAPLLQAVCRKASPIEQI
jgi:hypothetical protein